MIMSLKKSEKTTSDEQMNTIKEFFEYYDLSLKKIIKQEFAFRNVDEYATLNEIELKQVDDDVANRTQLSYTELLSSLLELNIKELYEEVLHEILHSVGAQKNTLDNFTEKHLIAFTKEAFKIEEEDHDHIYQTVKEKKAPNILLNIEVIAGKDIKQKQVNGSSNPFCVLYLHSSPQHKHNTSVKSKTLRPVWNEYFSLPVLNLADDVLHVEVRDFDSAETVKKKVKQIGDIKGMKGWKIFFKEVSSTITNSKQDNEIIGTALIPLQSIPSRGNIVWYKLRKKDKSKLQGDLLLKLSFGSEKNKHVAAQEHRHILRVLLAHQMNTQKYDVDMWTGEFWPESNFIIQQHIAQSNIDSLDEYLCQWTEFINAHVRSPVINYKVFSDILAKLAKHISTCQFSSEEINLTLFWESTVKLLPFCYNVIRTIRKKSPEDENFMLQIEYVLNILRQLYSFEMPNDLDVFPSDMYGWLLPSEHTGDIISTLNNVVVKGAEEWYLHILDNNKSEDLTEEGQLQYQITVLKNLKFDLQRAIEFHNKLFMKKIQFPYASVLFTTYERKISEICEPLITRICMILKPINFEECRQFKVENDQFDVGTSLHKLYLEIRQFVCIGNSFCNVDLDTISLTKYHLWFQQGVARWLDIAAYKAMQRIERAVELDKLIKIDPIVEHSSSAVDTLFIFYQIKDFWQQLAWPDVEVSYSFVSKIIHDICICSLYYSDLMDCKVNYTETNDERFKVTKEWCLAVNNIEYLKQSILPFINELGLRELMDNLANSKSDVLAVQCRNTLNLIVENAIDILNNKLNDLLQLIVNKISPEIDKYLIEGGDVSNPNNMSFSYLVHYLYENFIILYSELNKEYFFGILDIQIKRIANQMFNFIQINIEKKYSPLHFRGLWDRFHILYEFLRNLNESEKNETIQHLEALLYLHSLETVDLIQEYYLGRLNEQNKMKQSSKGLLTVKLLFINDVLRIEVLNAYKIKSTDSDGLSDSFVKVRLLPKEKFENITKPVTAIQKKTHYPLFDECFQITLTPEQRSVKNAVVMFVLKEQFFLGMIDEFISESFLHFKDIPSIFDENDLGSVPQIKLTLTSPKYLDSKTVEALRYRTTDKLAKDFLKKEVLKIIKSNQ